MKLDELTPWLFSRTTGGIRWGLERVEEILADAGNPHRLFHSVLIAGTNGKGSVAALCDSVLREADVGRVGLYTSPHLVSFAERIRVDGRPIDDDALLDAAERLRPTIESTGASFFEATTAIAFLAMAEAGVEVAVVEVGLGGRLDATNVLVPVATAITNIARDHTDYLGEELAGIAREKAGIFREGVPAISGVEQPDLKAVIRSEADRVGAILYEVNAEGARSEAGFHTSAWGDLALDLPLKGLHQHKNAAVALELLGRLPDELRPAAEAVIKGIAKARWPGRLQQAEIRGTTWLFDVAHNVAGARSLADALRELDLPEPRVAVIGILADKDWRGMIPAVMGKVSAGILTIPDSAPEGRKWNPEDAAREVAASISAPLRVVPDLGAALSRAETMAPHGTVIVTGSVHTVGDAMAVLGVAPI